MVVYALVVRLLATFALLSIGLAVTLAVAALMPAGRAWIRRQFAGRPVHLLVLAWFGSLLATGGSLYFSEVVGFAPCLLCWYQRIAMYPLVIVLGVGVLRRDPGAWRYALPLAVAGFAVSIYHVVIQLRPSMELTACTGGVPCTARYVAEFGFVSIPFMAGAVFLLVVASMLALRVSVGGAVQEAVA